jgi:hypothetical protein
MQEQVLDLLSGIQLCLFAFGEDVIDEEVVAWRKTQGETVLAVFWDGGSFATREEQLLDKLVVGVEFFHVPEVFFKFFLRFVDSLVRTLRKIQGWNSPLVNTLQNFVLDSESVKNGQIFWVEGPRGSRICHQISQDWMGRSQFKSSIHGKDELFNHVDVSDSTFLPERFLAQVEVWIRRETHGGNFVLIVLEFSLAKL